MTNITKLKMNFLRQMDDFARDNFSDEVFYDEWLACGVPDEADDDMLKFIAQNKKSWDGVCECFRQCCKWEGLI